MSTIKASAALTTRLFRRRPLITSRPPLSLSFFTRLIDFKMTADKSLPECWGHRGASAAFPENTLASFEAAIRDGAEGIESDVHISIDDVVIMFHDPALNRTTNGKGLIRDLKWYGPDGMEHLRTLKQPAQSIPTFAETVTLLMRPENQHIKFNVDVKVQNDPARLFSLMHDIIVAQPEWETNLAPRILLGLWHPTFLPHAKKHLPYCRRSHISGDLSVSRAFFWDHVDAFSVWFGALTTADGERFRSECKAAGKQLMVWTVNDPASMVEAVRWGVTAILTDVPRTWLDLREALKTDYAKTASQYGRTFLWTTWYFYSPVQMFFRSMMKQRLVSSAGPFLPVPVDMSVPVSAAA